MCHVRIETVRGTIYQIEIHDTQKEEFIEQFRDKNTIGFYIFNSPEKTIIIPMMNIEKFEVGD